MFGGLPPPGLEGEDNRALLRRLGTPCAELWSGPMTRRLGELAEVGKVYDIRLNFLLGGLVLIVWCIPTHQMVQFNT